MDTAHLADGVRLHDPKRPVIAQVPPCLECSAVELEIERGRSLLGGPIPAIACNHARLVVHAVSSLNDILQLCGGIADLKLVVRAFEGGVRSFPDLEHPVDPGEVTVRAIAAELRLKVHFGDRGPEG